MNRAIVLDARGRRLSDTDAERARQLVRRGVADLVSAEPLTIRLRREVDRPARPAPTPAALPGEGKRILLHVCCAPCATYTVRRLRDLGFAVTGLWYNPNVHPFSEHERRREALARYADEIGLPVIWAPGYDVVAFMRAIHGRERFRERCRICYELRLARTAKVAAERGFDAFTTTLLISPYQDQDAIRALGASLQAQYGVAFFFENFRQGWAEHHQEVRDHNLYAQRYCGCLYSEWEALDPNAATHPRAP
ncbi:MAG: epoxyqueuosine reductase QueH [Anaerolineae bacterium]|nr:epoxyqueuosine reductase QueH [Anaerolineae bacterium]